jgi:hypothetical protein
MHAQSNADFASQVRDAGSTEEFQVLMKNYIATHFAGLLGSKVLLLNTRDGLDTLSALVRQKLTERAGHQDVGEPLRRVA